MKRSTYRLSMSNRGLRPKLYVAISLMSVIPLLICLNFIFPNSWLASLPLRVNTGLIVVSAVVLVLAGFFTVKEMIEPVIKISDEAKQIANGDFEHKIRILRQDEIGDISASLNLLTHRIRDNMEELKDYGEKTREINLEINKRVVVLSSLLQISNLISLNTALNEILEIVVSKITQLGDSSLGLLMLRSEDSDEFVLKSMHGQKSAEIAEKGISGIKIKAGEGFWGKIITSAKSYILEDSTPYFKGVEELQKLFSLNNMIVTPFAVREEVKGLLIIGNNKKNFRYVKGDDDLLNIFSKQVAIAIENEMLVKNVAKLQTKDTLTGLFNETFIRGRLDEEIKRAIRFQRPCAFILLSVDGFKEYLNSAGGITSELSLKRIATVLLESISDIDKAARFKDDQFALVLPEKNKRQCLDKAEEIRKKIEFIFSEEKDPRHKISVTGAISENPIDGITAEELIGRAQELLKKAKVQNSKNTIIV